MCEFCDSYFLLKADKDKELALQKETDIKKRSFEYSADCRVLIFAHYKGIEKPYLEGTNKIKKCEINFCPMCGRDLRGEENENG